MKAKTPSNSLPSADSSVGPTFTSACLLLVILTSGLTAQGQVQHFTDPRDGRVVFIKVAPDQPGPRALSRSLPNLTIPLKQFSARSAGLSFDPVQNANTFLAAHGQAFGPQGLADVSPLLVQTDRGLTDVRYAQLYQGVPVAFSEITVHLDAQGKVVSANGQTAGAIQVQQMQPKLTAAEATEFARQKWLTQPWSAKPPTFLKPELCVFAPSVMEHPSVAEARLTWEITAINGSVPAQDIYFVDAVDGTIRFVTTGIMRLDREVYDCSHPSGCMLGYWDPAYGTNGYRFGRTEGQGPSGPNPINGCTDTDRLYDYLGQLDDYFRVTFGRDGGNNLGGLGNGIHNPVSKTQGYVFVNSPNSTSICRSTCFTDKGSPTTVQFMAGEASPDIVGHEYSHSLAWFSHPGGPVGYRGMVYQGESGALNEGQADWFGERFQLLVNGSTDWELRPEDINGQLARSLRNPTGFFNTIGGVLYYMPDHYQRKANFYCGSEDWGGVHHNATIIGYCLYLLAVGGGTSSTFCSVTGIGVEKTEQILYRAVTHYWASAETFNGAYYGLLAACDDLYGAGSPEHASLLQALQAVEIDKIGGCASFTQTPSTCYTCTDSDGGDNGTTPGTVRFFYGLYNDWANRNDYCLFGALMEFSCGVDSVARSFRFCTNGCVMEPYNGGLRGRCQ